MNLEEFVRRGQNAQRAVDNILAEQFTIRQERLPAPGIHRTQVMECAVTLLFAKDGSGDVLAIVTEVDGNPGASVTNAAENIATEIVATFGVDPRHLIYIEHYRTDRYGGGLPSTWDVVTFDWSGQGAAHPQWKPLLQHRKEKS
jgi:hypothetical protein